jgi:hypothetical protein
VISDQWEEEEEEEDFLTADGRRFTQMEEGMKRCLEWWRFYSFYSFLKAVKALIIR